MVEALCGGGTVCQKQCVLRGRVCDDEGSMWVVEACSRPFVVIMDTLICLILLQ